MKIIAMMNANKMMVEMTREEIRQLDENLSIEIGQEFPIMQAVKTFNSLRMLDEDHLEYLGRNIDSLKDTFEKIQDSHRALTLFDRLKTVDKTEE